MHPASLTDEQILADCDVKRTRAGGPGGQHRNKVETAIVITHRPTEVSGQASERRSQNANKVVALERLRLNLAVSVRTDAPETRVTSELWNSRRSGATMRVSTTHMDFAPILAEALDFLAEQSFEIPTAAKLLQISSSQLIKLVKQHRSAWEMVANEREKLGLHRLK